MKHEDFIKKLKGDIVPKEEHPVKKKFRADVAGGKKVLTAHGIFGPETPGTDGYVEEIIHPPAGGTFIKIYGCSYLYKGTIDADKVRGVSLAKSLVSDAAIKFLKSWPIALGVFCSFLFNRSRFIDGLHWLFFLIEDRVLRWHDIPEAHYNVFTKEIKRSFSEAILLEPEDLFTRMIRRAVRFFCFVIEIDNGYRYRFQDAMYEAYQRERFTILGILDVLIERETPLGIARKWKAIKYALLIVLPLWKRLRVAIQKTLDGLDISKVQLDEDDKYFAALFMSYNIDGTDFEYRKKWKDEMDTKKGHVFLV